MKAIVVLLILVFAGCSSLTYTKDGATITYSRFLAGSDIIEAKIGDSSVKSKGQGSIDPAALQSIIGVMGR